MIGTVEGDLHDIGKNLVAMMLEGAGFEAINLGTGVSAAAFVEATKKHGAAIVAMSALLTTTLPRMKEALTALTEAGLRDTVKVMAGGRLSPRASSKSSEQTDMAQTRPWLWSVPNNSSSRTWRAPARRAGCVSCANGAPGER